MSIMVEATANGYYGSKHRSPGEKFAIDDVEHFSLTWMDSDDAKVKSHVRKLTRSDNDRRAAAAKGWLKRREDAEDDIDDQTRRVNTGGTDGVVGAEVPKSGAKLKPKERIALAKQLSGREDITSAGEADAILAAANAGSDNDDRSRDFASDPANDAPDPAPGDDGSDDD